MYRDSYSSAVQPSIVSVATIAASLLKHHSMDSHDAVLKSYELLEIAAAGQACEMPLPEAYRHGVEEHRQLMLSIRQLEKTTETSLTSADRLVLMHDFAVEKEALIF
jgi:hypothetical protein